MQASVNRSPIYRNFEVQVRAQRAEAIVEMLSNGWAWLSRRFTAPPAARGAKARAINLAWLKASA